MALFSRLRLTGDRSWAQLDDVLLAIAGLASWVLLGWFTLVAGLALMSRSAGRSGRIAPALLATLAPRALRTVLATAVGVGSVAALTACAPAATSNARPVTTVAALLADPSVSAEPDLPGWPDVALDWPATTPADPTSASPPGESAALTSATSTTSTTVPGAPSELSTSAATVPDAAAEQPSAPAETPPPPTPIVPTSPAPSAADATPSDAATPPAAAPTASPEVVVVLAGDTLWAIAADHLPAGATDADIDAAWPDWYAANRAQIGDDPDLILPGWQLTTPYPDGDDSR
jgi:resuscitation-promoting factor RpfA